MLGLRQIVAVAVAGAAARKSSGDKRRTRAQRARRGVAPFVQQYIIPASVLRRIVQVGWPLPSGGYCAPPIRGHTSRDTAAAICIRQRRALRIDVKICSKISLGNARHCYQGSSRSSSLSAPPTYSHYRERVGYNLKNVSCSSPFPRIAPHNLTGSFPPPPPFSLFLTTLFSHVVDDRSSSR